MIYVGSARSMKLGVEQSVSEQPFYVHDKGWLVINCKQAEGRHLLALAMRRACANNNLTYSQPQREQIYKQGIDTDKPCKTDCSSLVTELIRTCLYHDFPNSTTATLPLNCMLSGLFTVEDYKNESQLFNGTILCTKLKGHVVIVTRGARKNKLTKTSK